MGRFHYTYVLTGGAARKPTLADKLRAGLALVATLLVAGLVLTLGAVVFVVLLPIALVTGVVGWLVIRGRIRRAQRAMEEALHPHGQFRDGAPADAHPHAPPPADGRENVRVRPPRA